MLRSVMESGLESQLWFAVISEEKKGPFSEEQISTLLNAGSLNERSLVWSKGEYGGAAVYVAEHAPQNQRGYFTSFIQTTATLGLLLSLIVILLVQGYVNGNYPDQPVLDAAGVATMNADGTPAMMKAFNAWGWRIPFLGSILLLLISLYIRLQMNESPAFKKMKEPAFPKWRVV